MSYLRDKHPLFFAVAAVLLATLSFQLLAGRNANAAHVDYGPLLQSLAAAAILAGLYFLSGGCQVGGACGKEAARPASAFAILLLAAAVAVGAAKVFVQKSSISPPGFAALLFLALLLATAVYEEILFRGFLFEAFARQFEAAGGGNALLRAALASSLLFGLLHVSSDLGSLFRATAYIQAVAKILEAGLFGMAMCALHLNRRSVWPCVAMHAAFNIASEMPIYLAAGVDTSSYLTGSPADIVVLLLACALLALPAKWAGEYLRAAVLENKSLGD